MKIITTLKGLFFGSVVILLSGCSQGKAADAGLKDAQSRVLAADQVTVVTPTKDCWFAKNITDLPSGKEVAIKVKPDSDQEFILVKSKSGDAVILPIMDGKCAVVTDKDAIAKYEAKIGGAKKSSSGGETSSSDNKSSWKVKGKTISVGMSRDQVIKLLGKPKLITGFDEYLYKEELASNMARGAKGFVFSGVPFGQQVSSSIDNPVASKEWVIVFNGGVVSKVRYGEAR